MIATWHDCHVTVPEKYVRTEIANVYVGSFFKKWNLI